MAFLSMKLRRRIQEILGPVSLALIAIFLFVFPQNSYGGRQMEDYDILPKIESIIFSETSIGFVAGAQKDLGWESPSYFVLDRPSKGDSTSDSLHEVDQRTFLQRFRGRLPESPLKQSGSREVLRASNGREFDTETAGCSGEGLGQPHRLLLKGKVFPDKVTACMSINALEVVGDHLWLGTIFWGELGEYPGEGIVIQSLEKPKLIGRLGTTSGLTGNLVRIIRLDPYSNKVWVATQNGLNEIDRARKVVASYYFYMDFDPATGNPTILVSPSSRSSHPLAFMSSRLKLRDPKAFYEAVKQIPRDLESKLTLDDFFHIQFPRREFFPPAMNTLVPFFLEAAQSDLLDSYSHAVYTVCRFQDRRVPAALIALEKTKPSHLVSADLEGCLETYRQSKLLDDELLSQRVSVLIERIQTCFANKLAQSHGTWCNPVADAYSLKGMGNRQSFHLINEYLEQSNGNPTDSNFYGTTLRSFFDDDELIPGVVVGLKKMITADVERGCQFFNGRRYKAAHAEAVLLAIDHALHPSQIQWRSPQHPSAVATSTGPPPNVLGPCAEAFRSQLRNSTVKQTFMTQVYPTLTKARKQLADRLMTSGEVNVQEGPDLVVPIFMPSGITSRGGDVVHITEITMNVGKKASPVSITRYFIVAGDVLDPVTARVIGERAVPTLGPGERSAVMDLKLTLPSDLPPGTYHLAACADATESIDEMTEENNCSFNQLQGGGAGGAIMLPRMPQTLSPQ